MVHVVCFPYRMVDFDYGRYLRELQAAGLDITNLPRVPEPLNPTRWLHASDSPEFAQSLCQTLRERTEDETWIVQAVDAEPSIGPLGPLDIAMIRRTIEWVYSITLHAGRLIETRFPEATIGTHVVIHMRSASDPELAQKRYWDDVARILTGLTLEQMQELGGYRIVDRTEGEQTSAQPQEAEVDLVA